MAQHVLFPHEGDEEDYRLLIKGAQFGSKKDVEIKQKDLLLIYHLALGCRNYQLNLFVDYKQSTIGHHLSQMYTDIGYYGRGGLVSFGFKHKLFRWEGDKLVQLWRKSKKRK